MDLPKHEPKLGCCFVCDRKIVGWSGSWEGYAFCADCAPTEAAGLVDAGLKGKDAQAAPKR